jgi:hypothetical protein
LPEGETRVRNFLPYPVLKEEEEEEEERRRKRREGKETKGRLSFKIFLEMSHKEADPSRTVAFTKLGKAPAVIVEALAAKLLPLLAPLSQQRQVAFLRLLLVAVARDCSVTGSSLRAIGMSTSDELIAAIGRVLNLLAPSQTRMTESLERGMAEMASTSAWSKAEAAVPDPTVTPVRGTRGESEERESVEREASPGTHRGTAGSVERALSTLARREEKVLNSHRLRRGDDDDVDDEEVSALQQRWLQDLPKARWPKANQEAKLVRRGWLAVADARAAMEARGRTAWLADLRASFAVRQLSLSIAEAQAIAIFAADPQCAGHALAAVLELSLRALPPVATAPPLLAAARLIQPTEATSGLAYPSAANLSGFAVAQPTARATKADDQKTGGQQQQRPDRPRICKDCKLPHIGAWSSHACSARTPAGATAPPSTIVPRKGGGQGN